MKPGDFLNSNVPTSSIILLYVSRSGFGEVMKQQSQKGKLASWLIEMPEAKFSNSLETTGMTLIV